MCISENISASNNWYFIILSMVKNWMLWSVLWSYKLIIMKDINECFLLIWLRNDWLLLWCTSFDLSKQWLITLAEGEFLFLPISAALSSLLLMSLGTLQIVCLLSHTVGHLKMTESLKDVVVATFRVLQNYPFNYFWTYIVFHATKYYIAYLTTSNEQTVNVIYFPQQ